MTKKKLNTEKNMEEEMVKFLEKLLKLNDRFDNFDQRLRLVYFSILTLAMAYIKKVVLPDMEFYLKLVKKVQQTSELLYESTEAFDFDLNKLFMVVQPPEEKS